MNIVYAMTRSVYSWALPSFRSLRATNPGATVYICCEDDEFPYELPFDATIINVSGQKWFPESGPNYQNAYSYINLLKVCYPELLPCDKVIHLDIDTIICEDLSPMWEIDLKDKWFAAAREDKGRYHPFGDAYFNMGIAVINLEQMRADGAVPLLADYLNAFRQPFADQDAWNKYGIEMGKAKAMPVRFNENFATGYTDNPAIVHYCGIRNWYGNRNIARWEYQEKYLT